MAKDDANALTPREKSLFKPTIEDSFDSAVSNLDEKQVKEISEQIAKETIRLEVKKRESAQRYVNASNDMDKFIENADRLENRNRDFNMKSTFESASGTTHIEVSRKRTQTIVIVAVVLAVILLILYMAKH